MGQAGCGYYEMNGGVLEALGCFSVGGYGYGCFAQYGGTVIARRPIAGMVANNGAEVKTRGMRFASCNGGQTEYYMEGGTFRNLSEEDVWIGGGNDNDITCNFTINGPDAVFDCGATGVYLGMNSHDGIYMFNFNDGVFACGGMRIYRNDKDGVPLTNTTFCINFDGGTFRALDNNWTDPFCFGSSDQSLGPTNVAVYSGGAVIETDCTNVTFNVPFRGAWGKGIKAIVLSEPLKNVAYVGSPRVEITGDGIGASAFAHFDSEKMEIDRVIVTSPGCGYTTAEVKLIFDKTVALTLSSETGEVILEANANTGSFTKTGSGSVRLWATNTWGGATIVKGGVLTAHCDWAFPEDTALKLGGGSTVNLNNKQAKISSIEYFSGGGFIEGAGNAVIPETFSMSIDVSDIISGCPIVLGGDRNLDGRLLTVTGDDFSALDKTKIRYRVITVSGGTASGSPSIESAELPPRWSYVTDRKGVSLSYSRGTVLLFR
jgi:autotransporter-associated beta strand protein